MVSRRVSNEYSAASSRVLSRLPRMALDTRSAASAEKPTFMLPLPSTSSATLAGAACSVRRSSSGRLLAPVEDLEVFSREGRDDLAALVPHDRGHRHQVDAGPEHSLRPLQFLRLHLFLRGGSRPRGKRGESGGNEKDGRLTHELLRFVKRGTWICVSSAGGQSFRRVAIACRPDCASLRHRGSSAPRSWGQIDTAAHGGHGGARIELALPGAW